MFGCTRLIRFKYEGKGNKTKSQSHAQVYTAAEIFEKTGLTRESLVLFALLSGCDYLANGLSGCGEKLAYELAKSCSEHAERLCDASSLEMPAWGRQLQKAISTSSRPSPKALGFPEWQAVNLCCRPKVSSTQLLNYLPCLRNGWTKSFVPDLEMTCAFLVNHFHSRKPLWWPIEALLPRELNHRLLSQDLTTAAYLNVKPKKKESAEVTVSSPIRNTFPATSRLFPEYTAKTVDCDLLGCVLRLTMPLDALQLAEPSTQKRRDKQITTLKAPGTKQNKTPVLKGVLPRSSELDRPAYHIETPAKGKRKRSDSGLLRSPKRSREQHSLLNERNQNTPGSGYKSASRANGSKIRHSGSLPRSPSPVFRMPVFTPSPEPGPVRDTATGERLRDDKMIDLTLDD